MSLENVPFLVILDKPIAAENPDEGAIQVAGAEKTAVDLRVLGSEHAWSLAAVLLPHVTPGGEKSNPQTERRRALHDVVDVVPVVIVPAVLPHPADAEDWRIEISTVVVSSPCECTVNDAAGGDPAVIRGRESSCRALDARIKLPDTAISG
jgi:hypothetical protein